MIHLICTFYWFLLLFYWNYAQSLQLSHFRKTRRIFSTAFFFKKWEDHVYPQASSESCLPFLSNNKPYQSKKYEIALIRIKKNANTTSGSEQGKHKNVSHLHSMVDTKYGRHYCFVKPIFKDMGIYSQMTQPASSLLGKTVAYKFDSSFDLVRKKRNSCCHVYRENEKDEYTLINEHILLKKNGKTIKELMEEGKWMCPKENIAMIRERTKQKINWNYILKKNNELLQDNVHNIYKEIVTKNTVDDIFFTFETYPYNYLNIPMSIFSLYKIASSYLTERVKKEQIYQESKVHFFNIKNLNRKDDNNYFSLSDMEENETNTDIFKIKKERQRLNEILKNRNFRRIVGSLNKHLKIIYKVFSTNSKLTSYEKSKTLYQYIPYINIKDIITILKCFCILKLDHVNIFKYIYFFIVFFIEKFDIHLLTEAVYLCYLKKIYIKPLFQNYTKYLLRNLNRWDFDAKQEIQHETKKTIMKEQEKEKEKEQEQNGEKDTNQQKDESQQKDTSEQTDKIKHKDTSKQKGKMEINQNKPVADIDPSQSVLSWYENINVEEYYSLIEQILKGEKEIESYQTTPIYLTNFEYTIYESGNYSNLNYSQDELKKMKNESKEDTVNKLTTQNYLKEKNQFLNNQMEQTITNNDIKEKKTKINSSVYILYILSKFPYTNTTILHKLCSNIFKEINSITLEEMILSFYSLAVLEYDEMKLQNGLYTLILKNIHLLNLNNKDILLKLIRALYLTNNLTPIEEQTSSVTTHKKGEVYQNGDIAQLKTESNDSEPKKNEQDKQTEKANTVNYINNETIQNVKHLMLYIISKIILKKKMDYTPIELVDIIRYLASLNFVDKELFHFVFSLPFFKNINKEILDKYTTNIYLNNAYYAYTKNSTINTPLEIMLCKFYQTYLGYHSFISDANQRDTIKQEADTTHVMSMKQRTNIQNIKKGIFTLPKETEELLKQTYIKNMEISSYSSSSLHYEIADIILKDFHIPCYVEYKTQKGITIDIAILYDDLKKKKKNLPPLKNIAIEINGPFHYKTKALTTNIPKLNTKTIFKKRILESDNWQVISFPFWEIKPWFTKTRKEKYILKMLPEIIKNAFTVT